MNNDRKKTIWNIVSILFALSLWQLAAAAIGNSLLFVGPIECARALIAEAMTASFWKASLLTAGRIALSFVIAFLCAAALAALSAAFPVAELLLKPYIVTVKTVPVASFIVIALLWLSSSRLSVFIAFLMVLPVLYQNILQGIRLADRGLLEVARVFRMPLMRRLRLIYIPSVEPYVLSAAKVALGMSWKAGIAAEVIGISPFSIGGRLYEAKNALDIPQVFAWTVMTVILSVGFEKLVLRLLRVSFRRIENI